MDNIQKGDSVVFYDCDRANKDRDFSGVDKKYYPVGRVIDLRPDSIGRPLVDIQLPDGRISKGHFKDGVKKV